MAVSLRRVKVAPKGMGLNDFVAMQEGFFAAEGLDVEFDWKTFRGTQSSWKGLEYFQRPQDRPYTEDKQDVVQGACLWGTICNASAGMGRVVTEGYGDSPWAIFVRPDSKIRKPEDLKDVPISVGMRAGSHFNVPYRLERYLPLEHIKTVNTGGFGARLRALLDGEVEAASLLPPQIAMAEQLGLRKIIEDRFKTLWWVPENATADVVHGYMRALNRAEQAMDADLPKYLPLWKLAVPAEFENYHAWDFSKFGRGERFVNKPLPRGRIRRSLRAGRALGPRSVSQGPQPRDAVLSGLTKSAGNESARPLSRALFRSAFHRRETPFAARFAHVQPLRPRRFRKRAKHRKDQRLALEIVGIHITRRAIDASPRFPRRAPSALFPVRRHQDARTASR